MVALGTPSPGAHPHRQLGPAPAGSVVRIPPERRHPMNETLARRFTGLSCLAAAVALIAEVPLYFVYSGPPPDTNVLGRLLIGILALGFLLVFVTGFRE